MDNPHPTHPAHAPEGVPEPTPRPKYAIVRSSDLTKYNRWDAGFFIALQGVRDRYEQLQASMPVDEAHATLKKMKADDKKACLVLSRRQKATGALEAIEKEYPHLALALIEPTLQASVERIQKQIENTTEYLDLLKKIGGHHDVQA